MEPKNLKLIALCLAYEVANADNEIDSKEPADDSKVLQIINKMIKQRMDSIDQFDAGGRSDLAEKERD